VTVLCRLLPVPLRVLQLQWVLLLGSVINSTKG
jgi:hypothetical protein